MWNICRDVKLLFGFTFSLVWKTINAGGQCTTDSHCPTKTLSVRGDTEPDQLCVPASIFHFSEWRPAKPSTGMSFGFQFLLWIMLHLNLPQNFDVNRFQSTVWFSQFELLPISSDGTVAFSKDKERIHIHWFSCPVIQFLLSDFRGLFVHVRCIPHQ